MNIRLLFYLITFLLYNNLIYGLCEDCNYTDNIIVPIGNTSFEANITADEYYWEICEGSANIIGSNTSSTVLVKNVLGLDYTIKLVQFNNGNCTTACKMVDGDPCISAACPQSFNIGFFTDLGIDFCGGTASLTLSSGQNACIDYVDWTVLGGSPTYINSGSTSEEISLLLSGSINICAVVVYENRAACEEICRSFNLNTTCCLPGSPDWPDCEQRTGENNTSSTLDEK